MGHFRRFVSALALAGVLFAPVAGLAGTEIDNFENRGSPPMVDAFLMRPLGLAMLGVSCALFVPAALVTGITRPHEMRVPYERMVLEPARFVFSDPLGSH